VTRLSARTIARSAALSTRIEPQVTIHLRKMYVDCRFGQLHLHTAFPSSGGFDELTPLVCVPPLTKSGRVFRPLLKDLGRDRSAYAPDLPGCGESDAPHQPADVQDQAGAILDLLDSLRLRQVDVLGYQGGSMAAVELAIARPEQVRRVVLMGVPASEASFQAGERLPLLRQPVLVLRPRDETWESTGRTEGLLREARRIELPNSGANVIEAATDDLTGYLREFLDR
jgi:pimeloyl-ACP methyl ester carboxylesterase